MPTTKANGIELYYEIFGDDDGPPLLLVMGLGAQSTAWEDEFCQGLADRGFRVIRFDNRDTGLSTKIDHPRFDVLATCLAAASGDDVAVPYLLTDMAADAVGLLDALGLDAAHMVGASMGGMIAQTIAIEHPHRVLSLTSIMSTTGDADVGQPTADAMAVLTAKPATDRAGAIEQGVLATQVIAGPEHFDAGRARQRAEAAYDRCNHPRGIGHQLVAILASGSRTEALRRLTVPTLVIHGDLDPLITPTGGERTAEAVPGAELLVIEGMGHDLPPALWPQIIEAITAVAGRAAAVA
ncbi:alpha/beta hydrolase [soil metagenome]